MQKSRKILMWSAIGAAVIVGLLWWILGYAADTLHLFGQWALNTVWRGWLFPNGWNLFGATPFFWLGVIVTVLLFALFRAIGTGQGVRRDDDIFHKRPDPESLNIAPKIARRLSLAAVASIGAWAIFMVSAGFMHNDWNARHYNSESSYMVSDLGNLPDSLARINESSKQQVDIVETDQAMPDAWVKRSASSTGAAYVLRKTGNSNTNTELLSETVTYIYNTDDDGGSWTGIRNGIKRQPIYGVSSWEGTGKPVTTCKFEGSNELKRSFGVGWGLNLSDDIAQFDPNFVYDKSDVYGYCDDDKPVIVIPGTKVIGHHVQTASTSHGVLIVTGSPSGEPAIEHRADVKPGEVPGPVYPTKLVNEQLDALKWSAGRVWPWQPEVGYEPVGVKDILLKSKDDGRLYWVSPLKPRNTDSQTIAAYSVTSADQVMSGKLNEQRLYVLNDNDSRSINFNDLSNAVTQAVGVADPGFFTGGEENQGNIVEFIPTSDDSWQVFAERGGRAVYKIDVSGGQRMNTSVIAIDEESGDVEKPVDQSVTGDDDRNCSTPAQLSSEEIALCMQQLSNELVKRGQKQ